MRSANALLQRYEVAVNKYRTRPKSEDDLIIEAWAEVTELLEARSFEEKDPSRKKAMRMGAREVRYCLAAAGHVTNNDIAKIKAAEAMCFSTMEEVLESRVADVDAMAALIVAKHPLHHRLNACRIRAARAICVILRNIEHLRGNAAQVRSGSNQTKEGNHE